MPSPQRCCGSKCTYHSNSSDSGSPCHCPILLLNRSSLTDTLRSVRKRQHRGFFFRYSPWSLALVRTAPRGVFSRCDQLPPPGSRVTRTHIPSTFPFVTEPPRAAHFMCYSLLCNALTPSFHPATARPGFLGTPHFNPMRAAPRFPRRAPTASFAFFLSSRWINAERPRVMCMRARITRRYRPGCLRTYVPLSACPSPPRRPGQVAAPLALTAQI